MAAHGRKAVPQSRPRCVRGPIRLPDWRARQGARVLRAASDARAPDLGCHRPASDLRRFSSGDLTLKRQVLRPKAAMSPSSWCGMRRLARGQPTAGARQTPTDADHFVLTKSARQGGRLGQNVTTTPEFVYALGDPSLHQGLCNHADDRTRASTERACEAQPNQGTKSGTSSFGDQFARPCRFNRQPPACSMIFHQLPRPASYRAVRLPALDQKMGVEAVSSP